jgi:uridylate kinase
MQRILLKISGELLKGSEPYGISQEASLNLAKALKKLHDSGTQLGIVIGGGNIFRGVNAAAMNMERTPADQMGMLATLINGIAFQESLKAISCPAVVMSALDCPKIVESYNWHKANEYLDSGHIVIFVGGTGNPYFTTDTAAALRANEIGAEALWKATKVDGVYDKDPLKFPGVAKKYDTMSYEQFLAQKLEVMDATSVTLCMKSKIPIFVFQMNVLSPDRIGELINQKPRGTLIT